MTNEELILETNQLLKKFLELEEKARVEHEEAKKKFESEMSSMKANLPKEMEALRGQVEKEHQDKVQSHEERLKAATEAGKANIEELKRLDREYKETLMKELEKQTDLLSKIAEKLGA